MNTTRTTTTRQRRIIHGLDLEGWDAIASALDVSIRTAQRLAQRDNDPLPVSIFVSRARASTEHLREWSERNRRAA
jgi:hypothetical protein